MPRPYVLLQSRDPGDPMREHEVACFRAALGAGERELVVVDAVAAAPEPGHLRGARALLLGGSGDAGLPDELPWMERLADFLRDEVVPSNLPTFASCFGHHVLAHALGGSVVRDPARQELGSIDVSRTHEAARDPLFGPLPDRFVAQTGHTDRVVAPPPGTELLASTRACPVQAYRLRGRPVWATQFHPELDVAGMRTRWLHHAARCPPADLAPGVPPEDAPFLRRLRPSPDASSILLRFASIARP